MKLNKLKGSIVEKGLTQKQVAQKMGLSLQSLNSKLNEKRPITVAEAYQLTEILHLENPTEIFFAHDVP